MEALKLILILFFFVMSLCVALVGYVATTNSCPKELDLITRVSGFVALLAGCYGCFIIYASVELTINIQL